MNKKLGYSLAVIVIAIMMIGNEASALSYKAEQRPIEIILDGRKVEFKDSRPILSNSGTTYVPIRVVSEQLGAKVSWNAAAGKALITKGNSRIELNENSKQALVNGRNVALDAPMVVQGGRTLVPLRFVSECLQVEVKFDDKSFYIYMKSDQYDESANYDPYGRKIRTTNLPKNAKDFPYILEDIPNEMYEMRAYIDRYLNNQYLNIAQTYDKYKLRTENVTAWKSRIEKYYGLILNANYNTINYDWAKEAYSYLNMLGSDQGLREYVDWVKKNKIIIEGNLVVEPSIVYFSGESFHMRSAFKFRIISFNSYKNIIYDTSFHLKQNDNGILPAYKKGVWYEGYVDVSLSSTTDGAVYTPSLKITGSSSLFRRNAIINEVH